MFSADSERYKRLAGHKTRASIFLKTQPARLRVPPAAYLGILAWRTAMTARGPSYRFFGHLRTITV